MFGRKNYKGLIENPGKFTSVFMFMFVFFFFLSVSLCAVLAADSSGDGGFPEEAGRVLRGSEAVPEERLRSERLLSVSLQRLMT